MKNVMERFSYRCVKYPRLTFMRFCGLSLALSLFCFCFALIPSPANAVSFNLENSKAAKFTSGIAVKVSPLTNIPMTRFTSSISYSAVGSNASPWRFQLYPDSTIKKNQLYQLSWSISTKNYNSSVLGFSGFTGFTCEDGCMVVQQEIDPTSTRAGSNENFRSINGVVWVQILSDNYWSLTLQANFQNFSDFTATFYDGTVADIVFNDTGSAIINQTEELKNSQQQTTDAVNNQTEQQKNQYEQDKQEEADREQAGKDDAGIAGGIFNFSVLNPFAPLLHLFNPGNACVSIPVLSSWLHTEQTSVCPFFPSGVRSIVTPVLGISSMMLLFGFVMRWLRGSEIIHLGGD